MKNILKALVAVLAVSFSFSSCQKGVDAVEDVIKSTHTVKFVADKPETKTSATHDENTVYYAWAASDEQDNGAPEKFHVYENGVEATAVEAVLSEGMMMVSATFAGTAPDSPVYTCHFNSGVRANQKLDNVGGQLMYDQLSDVLVAKEDSSLDPSLLQFSFKREVAFGEVTLKGLTVGTKVSTVIIEATDDNVLAADYSIANGFSTTGSSKIVIENANLTIANGQATFPFVTIPVENAQLKISVNTVDENGKLVGKYEKEFAKPISFTRGDMRAFSVSLDITHALYFYESFNTNEGTGGNDDQWSGSIASNDIVSDHTEWAFDGGYGGKQCVRFGTAKASGSAKTPEIDITTNLAMLKFKAAAWNAKDEVLQLNLGIEGGTLADNSVTLVKGQWSSYKIGISEVTGPVKVTFMASANANNRFFLDEVEVYYGSEPEHPVLLTGLEWKDYTASYEKGSEFSIDGTIEAIYSNGDKQILSATDVTLTTSPDMSTVGPTTAVVSYTSGNVTRTATANITITDPGQGGGTEVEIYTTGFETSEGYSTSTSYQGTVEQNDWKVYYGTFSTSAAITGSSSLHMRLYSNKTTEYAYAITPTFTKATSIAFNYQVSNRAVQFKVQVSTDGGITWTDKTSVSPSGTTKTECNVSFGSTLSSAKVKILVTGGFPTSSNYTFRIDDVVVKGMR